MLPEDMQDEYEEEEPADKKYAIESAIASADFALQCLSDAQAAMNNSSNVGFRDMFSREAFTSVMKYSALEDAEQELMNAQDALQSLNDELKNLLSNRETQLQFTKLASVADMWFDSGFMDCLTHLQIGKVQKGIDRAVRRVASIRRELVGIYNGI